MIWCIDFKGQFRLGNQQYCYPLTITDQYSRYLLECYGLESTGFAEEIRRLTRVFREYGLPEVIRSDNGSPFASTGLCGLSQLNVWWMKLGIIHDRIDPGCPQQNGQHERMHRTLKAEATRPAKPTMAQQQRCFNAWRKQFNQDRPHQGIGNARPADLYQRSARALPARLPVPEYAGHYEVRRVRSGGVIQFKGRDIFVSQVLEREQVALEEIDEGIWRVLFYQRELGRLDQREFRIH
jgi:transposase InsO family protein